MQNLVKKLSKLTLCQYRKVLHYIVIFGVLIFFPVCNPKTIKSAHDQNSDSVNILDTIALSDSTAIDFGTIFYNDSTESEYDRIEINQGNPLQSITFPVNKDVRVALALNVKGSYFFFPQKARVSFPHKRKLSHTKVKVWAKNRSYYIRYGTNDIKKIALPCTLSSSGERQEFQFEGKKYGGKVVLHPSRGGRFSVINVCPLERYVCGVVPFEVGFLTEEHHKEALKVQAIAARTYVTQKMFNRRDRSFDVYATVKDQVYGGTEGEIPAVLNAVRETRGMVLTYKGELAKTFYHSTCGGKTAALHDVWGGGVTYPYLQSIDDVNDRGVPYCARSKHSNWREQWSSQKLTKILHKNREVFPHKKYRGTLRRVKVASRYSCGRVRSCRVVSSAGRFYYGGDKIRFLFRTDDGSILKSSRFTVKKGDRGTVLVEGKGFGHGIGMCQHGAIGRAEAGWMFDEILYAYYVGTEICVLKRG